MITNNLCEMPLPFNIKCSNFNLYQLQFFKNSLRVCAHVHPKRINNSLTSPFHNTWWSAEWDFTYSSRFNFSSNGIFSLTLLTASGVIFGQPYKSREFRDVIFSATASKPLSVRFTHCPKFRVWIEEAAFPEASFLIPWSVTAHVVRKRDVSDGSPAAMCLKLASDTLLQKDTSRHLSVLAAGESSDKKPTPMSLTLSQDLRLRISRHGSFARDLSPVSVTLTQKLRFIFLRVGIPTEMCFRESSVSFWQSWSPRILKAGGGEV